MNTITDYWEGVEEAVQTARLIAWDGCHKIYLAMDETQARWFTENYSVIFSGASDEMLVTLRSWYEHSCCLKFIQAVETDGDDPNEWFTVLIPQGAEYEDEDEDEDEYEDF